MSPRMEADFDWTDVQASTPIYKKGDYELIIKSIRGQAWFKKDQAGNTTDEVTRVIRLRPEMVGVIDSSGRVSGEQDGKTIAGEAVEEAALWLHSEGGRKQAKKIMMAIAGYNPEDGNSEKEFNEFLKKAGLDLSNRVEEGEDGKLTLVLGEGWEKLLVGKNVRVHMEPEVYKAEGKAPVEQQNFVRFSPINTQSAAAPRRQRATATA